MSNPKDPSGITQAGTVELAETELDHVAGGNAQYNPKELQINQNVPAQRPGKSTDVSLKLKMETEIP